MVPGAGDFLFPTYGPIALKEKDGKVDSKVSDTWSAAFETILSLHGQYENLVDSSDGDEDFLVMAATSVGSINSRLGSHHGKKGANVAMSGSTGAAGLPQIFRSGWEVRAAHSLFDYIFGTCKMDTESGKVLAGWRANYGGQTFGGYPPEAKDIADERDKLLLFVKHLFSSVSGVGYRILETLAMTVLFRFDSVVADIQKDPTGQYLNEMSHPFPTHVHRARVSSGVSLEVFDKWKESAIEGFTARNKPALAIDFNESMKSVLVDSRCLISAYNSLTVQVSSQHGKVNKSVLCLQALSNVLTQRLQPCGSTMQEMLIRQREQQNDHIAETRANHREMMRATRQTNALLAQIVAGQAGAAPPILDDDNDEATLPSEELPVMKYSQYRKWKSQKVKPVIEMFVDWFLQDLERGWEVEKAEIASNNEKVPNDLKSAFRRHRYVVEAVLKCCIKHPAPRPQDSVAIFQWEKEVRAEGEQAVTKAKADFNTQGQLSHASLVKSKATVDAMPWPPGTPKGSTFWKSSKAGVKRKAAGPPSVDASV